MPVPDREGRNLTVAVLLGGTSEERRVSIASGRAVVEALRRRGHAVTVVDPAIGLVDPEQEAGYLGGEVGREPPGLEDLRAMGRAATGLSIADFPALKQADAVFLALHGGDGENGRLQAVLDMAGLPYTGSGSLGSALAFDKRVSKELLAGAGVPTPPWTPRGADAESVVASLGLPLVVKPSGGGSTVGLTIVREADRLQEAMRLAARYDDDVLCEEFIPGRELTVTVLEGEALPVVEIIPSGEIYDYEAKYTRGGSRYVVPAELSTEETNRIQSLSVTAFHALRQRTLSRIDFRRRDDGTFWCLEANSLPGLTATSLVPKSAAAAGIDFGELCERLARAACHDGAPDRVAG